MQMLTAKEIADRLASSSEGARLLFERIRHWSREGLLSPAGQKNPGTGRSRLYDESAARKARALNSLTECGITIRELRVASEFLDSVANQWLTKPAGPSDLVYLVIQKFRLVEKKHMAVVRLTRGEDKPELRFGKNIEYAIVADLTEETQ
jgi:DNA-binding transcriptional MerR regulator